jgi:PAS domain S-box-containing protein
MSTPLNARAGSEVVTQSRRAERAEDLHARVVNSIRGYAICALDGEGRVILWNPGAEQLTGYSEQEALHRPYAAFGSGGDAAEAARLLQLSRNTGGTQQERWWRRRDGSLVLVEEQIRPLSDGGFALVAQDLSDRLAEQELREQGQQREVAGQDRETSLRRDLQAAERRASFLAEASSILVATSLDFDSTLKALARLAVSRLADWCAIHTMDADEVLRAMDVAHRDPSLDAVLSRAVDGEMHPQWQRPVQSVLQTGQAQILGEVPVQGWLRSGQAELLGGAPAASVMVAPLLGRGAVLGTVTFVAVGPRQYDEEDLALAEELGRRAAIALDNARLYRDAQEANRAKADFLAVISHELRTPLNAIMGYSDLLDAEISGDLSERQRRQVDRIRASARHLLQLIEEILSYARIESGGEELQLSVSDASEIARDAAAVIEPLAESRGIEFRLEVGPPVSVETDAGKLRQVLVNLLSNAVKFTDRGHAGLRVEARDDAVVFHVTDTGVGIPAAELGRIFDPFWQVERPNTRRVGGTGLGLSVSRRYARLLHGDIAVASEPGRGTHVTVTVPLRITGRAGR